jgi:hypothetical protein
VDIFQTSGWSSWSLRLIERMVDWRTNYSAFFLPSRFFMTSAVLVLTT